MHHKNKYSLVTGSVATVLLAVALVRVQAQVIETAPAQEVRTKIGAQEFSLLFPRTNVPTETKVAIATDLQLVLAGMEKATFAEITDKDRRRYMGQYETAVTHRLDLDNHKGWLPKALREHFGMAVKAGETFHLVIPQVVLDSYKKALEMKKRNPVMFSQVDDFLATLQNAEKRQEIASDPRKAREMFYFYMMKPWKNDDYYTTNFKPQQSLTIRHPSLLEFKTVWAFFRESGELSDLDPVAIDILGFTTLTQTTVDGIEYADNQWPFYVYVDGQWRILVCPMP